MRGGAYSRGLIKLFDKCRIKSSLSKLLSPYYYKNSINLSFSLYESLHHHQGWGLIRGGLLTI